MKYVKLQETEINHKDFKNNPILHLMISQPFSGISFLCFKDPSSIHTTILNRRIPLFPR